MSINIKRKDWDSDFFGIEIFELLDEEPDLNFVKELKNGNNNNISLIYWFRQSEFIKFEEIGAKLVDIKVLYSKVVESCLFDESSISSFSSLDDYKKLVLLSLESGSYSRFKVDSGFKNNAFEKLYTEWIRKSVRREIADEVLIYKEQNDIIGMVTISFNEDNAIIGLIAVKENHRGKRIGRKLLMAVNQLAFQNRCTKIKVHTQMANKPACHFYEESGFKLISSEWVYHLWI